MRNILVYFTLFIYQVKTISEKFYNFDYVFVTFYYDLKLRSKEGNLWKDPNLYLKWFELEL
jgi:hypothetical protein